ncbi:CidA/LrgA family protein [Fusobacterium hwasookii]|jgi:lrgA family protein|uniref:Murein hydrolase transporter LrgA n=3 Tax=Fusobacterium hwasookii TaxID=1583098 RepID=A0A0S2ZM87_9FUSO|nr:CidA/LrgA family protein [Fusobacterium hwasookii]ALQ35408.1 murein hydrolase transporter LrgA [Fusobacterium hwasookii ChDC F206]ALQ37959.1 murein hydrolase transporter LrgA [Fusobacterium hwasookii ChDC F300]ALQ39958.1 murein hydrolase transporter LrgA [Fusobacterium hwasookii ChDC F174]EJU08864.1 murein hydrolase exporter [Fusobacterium hwasookii ChDC F128]QNE66878.1 CidA/LrgA family protein [Fusobacterium hwasookii]
MLREFMLIFTINYVGILLSKILHLPLPGTIASLLLLFLMLQFKVLKLEKIENAGNFLLLNMTIFFMPPTVKIIDSYELLEKDLFKIIVIIIVSTFLTMGITGKVVQLMIDFKERKEKNNERDNC